jgi:hypothetical protein
VAATATPGTLVHTAVSGTADFDYITLEAVNTSTSVVTLTIEWGGTTSPDDHVVISLSPQRGRQVVIDRCMLNNGLAVRCYSSSANDVNIYGEVRTVTL